MARYAECFLTFSLSLPSCLMSLPLSLRLAAVSLLFAATARSGILPPPTVTTSATPYSASFVPANLFDNNTGTEFASLTRGAEQAGAAEVDQNPRSASVRLRAVEKVVGRSDS